MPRPDDHIRTRVLNNLKRSTQIRASSCNFGPLFDKYYRYCENLSASFRDVHAAHDVLRLSHKGWYLNEDIQDETTHGIALQLSNGRSGERWLAGNIDGDNDNMGCIDVFSVYATKEEAARAGDEMARVYAEKECEFQREEAKKFDIEQAHELIRDLRRRHSLYISLIVADTHETIMNDPTTWRKVADMRYAVKQEVKQLRKLLES